ncbi:hypothetical protein LH646_15215 [Streptomyces sp. WA1-19]|uniref:hypothetical protein n=1 Tax=unclassified Streptomyces TaxID=2593676 RepID=UPI001D03B550|nr:MULTISPECIES: hypothetical protein [unclassified Streptomyces]UDF08793.1 hypothetical protein LH646_15215 [Streptomyces sp. WA1-19]UYX97638.1 hypothetical protein OIM89_29775 [Streptomyces sp. BI87]
MAAAGGHLFQGQLGDGAGQGDRDVAEADADGPVRLLDVRGGQPGDRRWPLGIEEQQQASQAVFGPDGVVVQQTTGGGSAGIVVHGLGWAVPLHGREAEVPGDPLGEGPAHEVASLP